MNFASTILAAGMLGLAHANKDAFAYHRMALESILAEETNAQTEHYAPHHERVYDEELHYDHRHEHEDVYYHEPEPHYVHEPEEYSGYDHDFNTEYEPHVSYRHHDDDEFHKEFDQSCGVKDYCHRFAQMISRDHGEYEGH